MKQKIILKIDGMKNKLCETRLNETIKHNFKIKRINSSYRKRQANFITKEPIDLDVLKEIVNFLGYTIIDLKTIDKII